MKRTLILCVMLALTCGATYATDYVWSAGAVTRPYDCATAYTPNITPPLTSADRLVMDNGAGGLGATMTFPASGTITLGAIEIDCGVMSFYGTTATMRLAGGNGWGGDLTVRYSGMWSGYGGNKTFDVDGNVYFQKGLTGGGWTNYSCGYSNLVMRGVGKTVNMPMDSAPDQSWGSVIIYDCASISTGGTVATKDLFINGTITGGNWMVGPKGTGTAAVSVIKFGPNGAWTGGKLVIINYAQANLSTTQYVDLGGGTYPQIEVDAPNSYISRQVIRLKGDVATTSNLAFMKSLGSYASALQTVLDTDNGSGKVSNITVGGNLDMNGVTTDATNPAHYGGIRGRTATIDINGDATFGRYAYLKGDTSTWKFAKNVTFTSNYRFDNSDIKTSTFVIDGTGAQSLQFGQKVKLGDLVINKTAGTAALTDNVLLAGDFRIDCGTFNPATYYVNFKGGFDNLDAAQQIDAHNADLKRVAILQGSSTWVQLMSDLTVHDNLDIYTGCKLFLNGFTLTAINSDLKQDYSGAGTWTVREGGEIVGAAVPEPATLLMLGTGALGALGCIRRQRMKK